MTDLEEYRRFIQSKEVRADKYGFAPKPLNKEMKTHQINAVDFALNKGRAALFLDTGLGKSLCELEFARQCAEETGKPSLILTPLAVGAQMVREGEKFGIEARRVRDQKEVGAGVMVSNYEMIHNLDTETFGCVVLDESSILKNFTGTIKRELVERFKSTPYRLAATATPAPNDNMEIGQHSEFLGIMPPPEMLSRWFISDQTTMGGYRLKAHSVDSFWEWVAGWSRCATLPSDLGGDDTGYILPEIDRRLHIVKRDLTIGVDEGNLFASPEMSATSFHAEKRLTLNDRCHLAAELANHDKPVTVWCETNAESALLKKLIPDSVELLGSMTVDEKEDRLIGFQDRKYRVIIAKPKMAGFGVNWQHCAHAVFASISFSYEQHYQAVRRSFRFGQTEQVRNDIVVADTEMSIWHIVNEKSKGHDEMKRQMRDCMRRAQGFSELRKKYERPIDIELPSFLETAK